MTQMGKNVPCLYEQMMAAPAAAGAQGQKDGEMGVGYEEMLTGRTTSNKTVIFAGDPSLIGQIVPVTITEAQTWVLKGTLAE